MLNGGNHKSTPSSVATSTRVAKEAEKEDQTAEEPQMVSGAFLTCARISATGEVAGETANLEALGCGLRSRANKKIMISDNQIAIKHMKGAQAIGIVSRRAPAESPWHVIVFLPPESLFIGRLAFDVAPTLKSGQRRSFEFNLEGLQEATVKAMKEEASAATSPQPETPPTAASTPEGVPPVTEIAALGSDVKPSHIWSSDTVYMVSDDFYPSMFCHSDGTVKAVLEYPVPVKYVNILTRNFVTPNNLSIKAVGPRMDQPVCYGKFENREDSAILGQNPRVLAHSNCIFMQDYKNLYIFDAATIKSDPDKYSVSRLDKIALSKMPCSR